MDNPHLRAESLRPKSDTELLYERIAQECGEAWLALKGGRPHPRINTKTPEQRKRELMTSRYARDAAFYPQLPDVGWSETFKIEAALDFKDRRHGAGGAERQE